MASAGAGGAGAGADQQIDISTVPIEQLDMMQKKLEQELKMLTRNHTQLRVAQRRFQLSKEAVEGLTPEAAGKEILVPLTDSLYVPGKLIDVDNVLVDIGTGYFVGKTTGQAQSFLDKKAAFVKQQCDATEAHINKKRRDFETVRDMLQHKMKLKAMGQE